MQAVLSQAGLELVKRELQGAVTCERLWLELPYLGNLSWLLI